LVLATAALHPSWKLCRGIELLPGIHEQAMDNLEACRRRRRRPQSVDSSSSSATTVQKNNNFHQPEESPPQQQAQTEYWKQFQQYSDLTNDEANDDDDGMEESLSDSIAQDDEEGVDYYALATTKNQKEEFRLAPIQLTCGSFDDPYASFFGDANIVFCFSTAMPYHVMIQLARAVGRQCLPGTLVITTEYQLPLGGIIETNNEGNTNLPGGEYELELVETMMGPCTAVGGESLVYIHRMTKTMGTGIPLTQP
jgi:hypothetical protein